MKDKIMKASSKDAGKKHLKKRKKRMEKILHAEEQHSHFSDTQR